MTPAFHIVPALWMGKRGQTTLPIVQTASGYAVQDSPRIIDWLSRNLGPLDVLPEAHSAAVRLPEATSCICPMHHVRGLAKSKREPQEISWTNKN